MEPTLHWLLEHEMRACRRYRRHMSLAMVALPGISEGFARQAVRAGFRDCDVILQLNGYVAVVMSETCQEGGARAVERCGALLPGREAFYSLVSYPADGCDAANLIESASLRLRESMPAGH